MGKVIAQCTNMRITKIYLFALENAAGFYLKMHFKKINPESLPEGVWEKLEKSQGADLYELKLLGAAKNSFTMLTRVPGIPTTNEGDELREILR